ncbi:hypothetical protein BKA82DRAFT_26527 [Pisolithus tinctorius]|nr:hypothetical protein BKA82DRAFT_26527 [Pisolithus tinctorius]
MLKVTNNDKMEDFFACLSADTAFMSALQANTVSVQQDQCIACTVTTTALTLEDFWHLFAHHTDKAPLQLSGAVCAYQKWKKEHCNAEHSAKWTLLPGNDLGLKDHALPYAKLADIIPDLAIIYHDHEEARQHKRGAILVDAGNEDLIAGATSPTLVVPLEGEDWYVVTPEKSAIFVNTEGEVELVVIRGCCGTHPDILEYVNGVISEAANDHKGGHVLCLTGVKM